MSKCIDCLPVNPPPALEGAPICAGCMYKRVRTLEAAQVRITQLETEVGELLDAYKRLITIVQGGESETQA